MIKSKIKKTRSKELIWVKEVINRFPQKVADYREGKNQKEILNFLKSCVNILSYGKVNLKAVEIFLLIELETKGVRNYKTTMIKIPKWNRKEIMS